MRLPPNSYAFVMVDRPAALYVPCHAGPTVTEHPPSDLSVVITNEVSEAVNSSATRPSSPSFVLGRRRMFQLPKSELIRDPAVKIPGVYAAETCIANLAAGPPLRRCVGILTSRSRICPAQYCTRSLLSHSKVSGAKKRAKPMKQPIIGVVQPEMLPFKDSTSFRGSREKAETRTPPEFSRERAKNCASWRILESSTRHPNSGFVSAATGLIDGQCRRR